MLRHLLAVIAASAVVGCQSVPQVVERHTSPAGHEFEFLAMPESKAVSIRVHWSDQWLRSPENGAAVPFLGTRMMIEGGAGELEAVELGERFEASGGRGRLYSVVDGVVGSLDVRADKVQHVSPLIRSVIEKPHFSEQWKNRIARDLAGQHDSWLQSAAGRLASLLHRLMIREAAHNRALMVQDSSDFLEVDRAELQAWRNSVFSVSPNEIVVAGRITEEKAASVVDSILGEPIRVASVESWDSSSIDTRPARVALIDPELSTSQMVFFGHLPLEADATEFFNRVVALEIFAVGDDSPLMRRVRSELGATYGFYWWHGDLGHRIRAFSFGAEVDGKQLEKVRAIVLDAWDTYRSVGPDEAAVARAVKSRLARIKTTQATDTARAAQSMLQIRLRGRDPSELDRDIDVLEGVTAESVKSHIAAHFPTAGQLVQLLATPKAGGWPSACEITAVEQAEQCRVE